MKFAYKARDAQGGVVSGIVEGVSREDAVQTIRALGVTPVSIEEKKSFTFSISFGKRVKLSEKIIFTKNLAGMLRAGLPLSRALSVLAKQTTNDYLKSIINTILTSIDQGESFSNGLMKYPKVFNGLFVAMVKSGEESGALPSTLIEIGTNLEKTHALNRKVKSALMYPSIIVAAILIIGVLMFIYVVPVLTKTFVELEVDLPTSTKMVVWLSDMISNNIGLLVLGVLVLGASVYMGLKHAAVKRAVDFLSTRLPVLGALIQEMNAARTTRTLSSLLVAGVSISRAISITKEVVQNSYYRAVLTEVEAVIQRGETISSVFQRHTNLYPVMVGEMIEVGEETGNLSTMLLDIATFYESEVDAKTKDLSTIIEPVLMIFIGAAVGFFAISMLSPMYSLMDSIN